MDFERLVESTRKLNVLYVEDYEDTREQVVRLFFDMFLSIEVGCDGNEGLELFEIHKDKIDLIVTDISMPNKNGIDMLKEIRKISKDVSVLILSAHSDVDYFLDAISLNIDRFLVKPLDIDQFLDALSSVVSKIEYNNAKELEIQLKDEILIQQTKLAMMGEMIDAIAHQWRQPLNAIGSVTSKMIFKSRLEMDIDNDSLLENFTQIEDQVVFMNSTLDEFRAFFRPAKNVDYIKIFDVIESIKRLLKDNIIKNSLNIEYVGCKEEKLLINENEIKHVFINLINNAKDEFNRKKLEDRKITILVEDGGFDLIISVIDNAGGVDESIMDTLFDANVTTKEDIGGTGVGLYMTKNIIKKNDGIIRVENIGDGAKFTMQFPRQDICKI
jgi:signal transduction histidine kinase